MAIATGEAEEAEQEAEVVEQRSSKGPHSRKDGNPLGWLARRCIAGGRGFGWARCTFYRRKEVPVLKGRGWFY
jgi:hypothetical protein